MTTRIIRSAPSGPEVSVLVPPDVLIPDPAKYLDEAGNYTVPNGAALLYTVGPVNVGRFQTIQAAITAAEAAGAHGENPALILILGGRYTENLTLFSGGIILQAAGYDSVYLNGNITFDWPTQTLGVYSINSLRVSGLVTHQGAGVGTKRFTTQRASLRGGVVSSVGVSWSDSGSLIGRNAVDLVPAMTGTYASFAGFGSVLTLFGGAALTSVVSDATTTGSFTQIGGQIFGSLNQTNNGGVRVHGVMFECGINTTFITLNSGSIRSLLSGCQFIVQGTSTAPVIVKNGAGIFQQGGNFWMGQGAAPTLIQINAGSVVTGLPIV